MQMLSNKSARSPTRKVFPHRSVKPTMWRQCFLINYLKCLCFLVLNLLQHKTNTTSLYVPRAFVFKFYLQNERVRFFGKRLFFIPHALSESAFNLLQHA